MNIFRLLYLPFLACAVVLDAQEGSALEKGIAVVRIIADTLFNPASVTKLVTGAAAFELLGPGYTFTTRVFTDSVISRGPSVTVRNLYVQGSGDPSFTAERLWLFVENLYHSGLRKITKDLIIDDFVFDSVTVGPGLDEDSTSRAYQPLISALSANFSTVAVYHRPGTRVKQPVIIELFPENAAIKAVNSAITVSASKKSDFKVTTRPDSGKTAVIVEGNLPIDETASYSYRRVWQTWEVFGGALRPLFKRRGISFSGKVVHKRVPRRLNAQPPLHEFVSLPLSKCIEEMFKYSSNFAAEMVFKTLSVHRDSIQGSWGRSADLVSSWWQQSGLPGQPVIKNGSGMGDFNRISASQVVALLGHVWNRKTYCPEYLSALSVGGVDGTVKSRFTKSRIKGLVRAKTGTLNSYGVSTLAGYLLLDSGPYAFAIFCSRTGKNQYDDWVLQEKILETVADAVNKK